MVQLKPPGKAYEVAKKVLKQQGVKVPKRDIIQKVTIKEPYLQH